MVSPLQKARTGLIAFCAATNCQANKGTLAGSVCIQKHVKTHETFRITMIKVQTKNTPLSGYSLVNSLYNILTVTQGQNCAF